MKILRAPALFVAGPLLTLAVACGGGGDGPSDAASTTGGGGALPAQFVDLAQSAKTLEELTSFRFDFSLQLDLGDLASQGGADDPFGAEFAAAFLALFSDIEAEGAYVAPDRTAINLLLGGETMGFVQIGDQSWSNLDGTWQAAPAADLFDGFGGLGALDSPAALFEDFVPQEILSGATVSEESVNGVDAVRYSFDLEALAALADQFGGDAAELDEISELSFDVWLAEGNIPVKLTVAFAGKDESGQAMAMSLDLNLYDINSGSVSIEPPI